MRVAVEARIVDLRSGELLWQGNAVAASSAPQQQGSIAGLLMAAVIAQVVNTSTDAAFNCAGVAGVYLLGAPRANGILPGPRSPLYGQIPTGQ